ncbi:tetratricopeptide repeat protein [Pseudoalteromonas sp. T1lg23B]|uniref:tetratricopeptide repeat protein n=1 Tax=Pseudoalteromonas sp. T1lg23B TaxID=2077097 RepID=UPI000CF74980|nr:tetratricopeptide repeat protein [Pseudoalteromonas sp. T1lg23B]
MNQLSRISMLLCLIIILYTLTGCKSSAVAPVSNEEHDEKFTLLIQQYKKSSDAVSYKELFNAYLSTSFINMSAKLDAQYLQQMETISLDPTLECDDFIDWQRYTVNNFFSVKPHLSAASCYESIGDLEQAQYHAQTAEFLIEGIKSSGSGEQYYSSYEVVLWDDAYDFIELSEFEVIDVYAKSGDQYQSAYLIFVVNDRSSGQQREIIFENNRVVHRLLDIPYPFAALNNSIETKLVEPLIEISSAMKMLKAGTFASRGEWHKAASFFSEVAQQQSAVANYKLSLLCLKGVAADVMTQECSQYALQSADMGYLNGHALLSIMYDHGLSVSKNARLADWHRQAAIQGSTAGQVWYEQAATVRLIDGQFTNYYLAKAASLGHLGAQYEMLIQDTRDDENKIPKRLQGLLPLAEQGYVQAQTMLGRMLVQHGSHDSEQLLQAKYWIDKAAESGEPSAHYLKGQAMQYGYFSEKNLTEAYKHYEKAAYQFHPYAQWKLGEYYLSSKTPLIGVAWNGMCALAKIAGCQYSLGMFYKNNLLAYEKAYAYFNLAAQQAHAKSEYELAYMYERGLGVKIDISKARALYQRSCKQNYTKACKALNNL